MDPTIICPDFLGDLFLCSGRIWWVYGFRGVNRDYNYLKRN